MATEMAVLHRVRLSDQEEQLSDAPRRVARPILGPACQPSPDVAIRAESGTGSRVEIHHAARLQFLDARQDDEQRRLLRPRDTTTRRRDDALAVEHEADFGEPLTRQRQAAAGRVFDGDGRRAQRWTPDALILSRPALRTRTRYKPVGGLRRRADAPGGTGPAGAAQGGVAGAPVSRCPVLSSSQRHLGGCRRVRHNGSTTSVVNWPVAARWCHTAIWTDCTEALSRRAAAAHESPSARSARTACTSVTFSRAAMTQARLQYIGPAATSLRRRQLALPQAAHTTAICVGGRPRRRRATAGASCAPGFGALVHE